MNTSRGDVHSGFRQVRASHEAFRIRLEGCRGSCAWGNGAPRCCKANSAFLRAASKSPRQANRRLMQPFQCARLTGSMHKLQQRASFAHTGEGPEKLFAFYCNLKRKAIVSVWYTAAFKRCPHLSLAVLQVAMDIH